MALSSFSGIGFGVRRIDGARRRRGRRFDDPTCRWAGRGDAAAADVPASRRIGLGIAATPRPRTIQRADVLAGGSRRSLIGRRVAATRAVSIVHSGRYSLTSKVLQAVEDRGLATSVFIGAPLSIAYLDDERPDLSRSERCWNEIGGCDIWPECRPDEDMNLDAWSNCSIDEPYRFMPFQDMADDQKMPVTLGTNDTSCYSGANPHVKWWSWKYQAKIDESLTARHKPACFRGVDICGDESRRRRGCDVDIPWRRVAVTPRLRRGYSLETSRAPQVLRDLQRHQSRVDLRRPVDRPARRARYRARIAQIRPRLRWRRVAAVGDAKSRAVCAWKSNFTLPA